MKNLNIKKKFRAVLKAAILGAILCNFVLWINTWIDNSIDAKSNHGFLTDLFVTIFRISGFFLIIPFVAVVSALGLTGSEKLAPFLFFIVASLVGAIVFGFIAIIWQFIKGDHENKK
jgi:formate/nitrite transporter FocA (FNT family)